MDTHTYGGSCHCGRVRFEVTTNLSRASQCNCSICTQKAYLHHMVVADDFRLLSGTDDLATYQFGTMTARHQFCTITCFMCFPFMQALSSYRNLTLLNRLLTALDEAMPYAFVGMVFAEAMAATAGLGFLMIIAGS